jgi:beta-galactosidase
MAIGMPLLRVIAHHSTTEELEQASHSYKLARQPYVILNIDYKQMGVGGDDSWGARPRDWCTLWPEAYTYSYRLKPVSSEDTNLMVLSHQRIIF